MVEQVVSVVLLSGLVQIMAGSDQWIVLIKN